MRDPYEAIAPVYDGMASDPMFRAFYEEWRRALVEAARERGLRIRVLVDLACGTGNSTIPWVRRGRTVIGVDRSAAMLRVARSKSPDVHWRLQDLTRLRIAERADAVTCHGDALNHVLDSDSLEQVFQNVAQILQPAGLFQFDLTTVHWMRWLNGRVKFFEVPPHAFTATAAYDEGSGIVTYRQIWFVRKGRLYQRRDVEVLQRAYTDTALRGMLKRAGLRLLCTGVQRSVDGKPARKLYLATRVG